MTCNYFQIYQLEYRTYHVWSIIYFHVNRFGKDGKRKQEIMIKWHNYENVKEKIFKINEYTDEI